jgi:hypothetical protein
MADDTLVTTSQDGRVTAEVATQLRKINAELAGIERRKVELAAARTAALAAANPITVPGDVVVVLEPRFIMASGEYELRRRRALVLGIQQRPNGTVRQVRARLYVGLTQTFDNVPPAWYTEWELIP